MKLKRSLAFLLCIALVVPGCAITEFENPDGSITKVRSIDVAQARDILMFALEAFDLVTARIALYKAQNEDISEPDALQLALAEARERWLRRGIDFLDEQFAQMADGQQKIRVPVGLMRRTTQGINSEMGVNLRISYDTPDAWPLPLPSVRTAHSVGVDFSFGTSPAPLARVATGNQEWRRELASVAAIE